MMSSKVIGWENTDPIPNKHVFTKYLCTENGSLLIDGFNLTDFLQQKVESGGPEKLHPPIEIVYLPIIRDKINSLKRIFQESIDALGYAGKFLYTYASKANAAEEVVRTVLQERVNYEISSWVDIEIVYHMINKGLFPKNRRVICNGFKPSASQYAQKITQLQKDHGNVIPVIEDFTELPDLVNADVPFEVGLRLKSYGHHTSLPAQDKANSRFGLNSENLIKAAAQIAQAANLKLRLFHGMVGSQITNEEEFVARLTPPMEFYARLKKMYPSLEIFDFGGGMPVQMSLDFEFDYRRFADLLLTTIQEICHKNDVAVPDVMGEFGRYTVAEHGAHIFKVIANKQNQSTLPWYIIDGSVMSSFPDSWALGEHFIVLPINHLDDGFQKVNIGGITCDSDDVYPPKSSQAALYLPKTHQDLYIGFFNIGAYQEMLGGAGGSKHCVIPEANEVIIDRDQHGSFFFERIPGQSAKDVLKNLGYK